MDEESGRDDGTTPRAAGPAAATPRAAAPRAAAPRAERPGTAALAAILDRASEAWVDAGRSAMAGEIGGVVAAAAAAVRDLPDALTAATDADVLALMDLAGQLKALVDSTMVGVVREVTARSSGPDRSEWLCRRAEFPTVQEMAQHLLHVSMPTVGMLKKAATQTAAGVAVSGAALPPQFAAVREAMDAGRLTLDQARPILERLSPLSARAHPERWAAAEADLVARATGGRCGSALPDPTDGEVFGGARVGSAVEAGTEGAADGASSADAGSGARVGAWERPAGLEARALRWAAVLDPDGPEPRDQVIRRRRGVFKRRGADGAGASYTIHATPESEAIMDSLLEAMINPRSGAAATHPDANPDSRQATVPGTAGTAAVVEGDPDTRTLAQRKHDALETLLSAVVPGAPINRASRPHLLVVARAEELLATLGKQFGMAGTDSLDRVDPVITRALLALIKAARGGPVAESVTTAIRELGAGTADTGADGTPDGTPGAGGDSFGLGAGLAADPRFARGAWMAQTDEVLPFNELGALICDGLVQTALTVGGEVMAYSSRDRRYFTANQRRALMLTYPECAVPGCTIPGWMCDAHHVAHVEHGGDTTLSNGILSCPFHHHQLHQGRYRIHPYRPTLPGRAVRPVSSAGCGPGRQSSTDRVPGADGQPRRNGPSGGMDKMREMGEIDEAAELRENGRPDADPGGDPRAEPAVDSLGYPSLGEEAPGVGETNADETGWTNTWGAGPAPEVEGRAAREPRPRSSRRTDSYPAGPRPREIRLPSERRRRGVTRVRGTGVSPRAGSPQAGQAGQVGQAGTAEPRSSRLGECLEAALVERFGSPCSRSDPGSSRPAPARHHRARADRLRLERPLDCRRLLR